MGRDAAAAQGLWGDSYQRLAAADEFSASVTLVHFDRPLPLLRVPLPAGAGDDPCAGPFVLAFRNADSWRAALRCTEAKVFEQCEAGARVGCSLSASKKCRPPWWKILFGAGAVDFAERERCEEREMLACVEASKEPCIQFAKGKCLPPFRDARVSSIDLNGFPPLCAQTCNSGPRSENLEPEQTNYRGSILLEDFLMEESYKRSVQL